jgi:hypothetical protein
MSGESEKKIRDVFEDAKVRSIYTFNAVCDSLDSNDIL